MIEKKKPATPIPVAVDNALLAAIDRVALGKIESRSSIMRAAIRAGLSVVEAGGGEFVRLDGPLKEDVEKAAAELEQSISKVLVESVRLGVGAYYVRHMRRFAVEGKEVSQEEFEKTAGKLFSHDHYSEPGWQEHIRSIQTIRQLKQQLEDLKWRVPEANQRIEALQQLQALRAAKGEWGPFPFGLPMEEIQSQIAELEGRTPPSATSPAPASARPAAAPPAPAKPAKKPRKK